MAKKRKRRIRWNIGMIVFLVIFIYVMINIVSFFIKKKLTVYRVTKDEMTTTFSFTGIALRDEKLLKASQNGYITYYVEEGKRVRKSGTLYILDKDGKVQETFADQAEALRGKGETLDDEEIQKKVTEFQFIYSDGSFSDVYDLKYDLKNTILNLNEDSMKEVIDAVSKKLGEDAFHTETSPASGAAAFYSDSFDGKTADDITDADFDQENYRAVRYNSSDQVKKGNVVCRVTNSENWTVVVPLEKSQYDFLQDKDSVTVKFQSDQEKTTADLKVKKKGNSYFGYLSLDDYVVRYLDERYLDIDITLDSHEGLKIPNSAVVKKKFYQVPAEYISKGNDGKEEGFSVRTTDDKGEVKVEQKNFTIYKKTKKYCYLDPEEVGEDVVLQSMDSDDTYLVEKTKTLEGVYCTNQGYADFRLIEKTAQKDDYCIVEENTDHGISLYDFIVLDSSTIKENQIIY
ncbi:HlyD family efflux transporter periplasmic adaptor subunit [Anaerostipes butyraticus]|uniref:HlyD family efflux transporter periplasmic adaptor subunit n=1 Tax=Anaerostipes butyraticus TaxID=645466 RepID=UPI0023A7A127|nr:HlyD family efflux transporter periplasmic adaptor subunit [Anaerostipes butyraticus]